MLERHVNVSRLFVGKSVGAQLASDFPVLLGTPWFSGEHVECLQLWRIGQDPFLSWLTAAAASAATPLAAMLGTAAAAVLVGAAAAALSVVGLVSRAACRVAGRVVRARRGRRKVPAAASASAWVSDNTFLLVF